MSEIRVLGCAMLLAGGVAAAVAAGIARHAGHDAPAIAGVRLAALVAARTAKAARTGAPEAETAAQTRAWALALETALAKVAHRHGAVLLPARAIAAGARDLTDEVRAEVRAEMARSLAQTRSGTTGTPPPGDNP